MIPNIYKVRWLVVVSNPNLSIATTINLVMSEDKYLREYFQKKLLDQIQTKERMHKFCLRPIEVLLRKAYFDQTVKK